MVKLNFTNNQTAFEYALFMIASSYFDRVECKNKLLEKNMLLQYKEQKLESQYRMEDFCIAYMDGLQKKFPTQIFKQNMKVHFRKEKNGTTGVIFVSRKYILQFHGVYVGKKSNIDCRLWVKKPGDSGKARKAA